MNTMKRPANVVLYQIYTWAKVLPSPRGVWRQNLHRKAERSKVSLDFTDEPINCEVVGGYFIFFNFFYVFTSGGLNGRAVKIARLRIYFSNTRLFTLHQMTDISNVTHSIHTLA